MTGTGLDTLHEARAYVEERPTFPAGQCFYSLSVDGNSQKPCEERSNTRCSSHVRGVITGVRQITLGCAGYEPFG